MKTRLLFAFIVLLISAYKVYGEEKAPVAEDDYATAVAPQTIAIHAAANDFAYDGHSFKIFVALGVQNGTMTFNDTMIFYTPNTYFRGLDSLRYRIVDLQNMMLSEFASVYIDVQNPGLEFLDVNEVNCEINACGNNFWDFDGNSFYEVPVGSGVNTLYNQSLWIGGMDEQGGLHLAGELYRWTGNDFSPGPMMDFSNYSDSLDLVWHRVWKLNSAEIEYHRAHWQDAGYEPIENIAAWPGNGDVGLGQASKLAPYYDWDSDGLYDPKKGDFPLTKGNQCIFQIFNDDRSEHSESGGQKLGVEIQALWYAYDKPEDSALQYSVFCNMNIINRSNSNYTNVMTGYFTDFDLGTSWDDFIGCDTLLNSGYCYNGYPTDGSGGEGTYDIHPPAQSFSCLNFEMTGFGYFRGFGDYPEQPDEYFNFLNSMWKDSTYLTYGGNGYGGDEPVKFAFSGDPVAEQGWTENNAENEPGERNAIIVSGPNQLLAGDTLNFEFALVFARDYEGDNISSVSSLRERIGQVKAFYENSLGVKELEIKQDMVNVFPNPVKDVLQIKLNNPIPGNIKYQVLSINGDPILSGELQDGFGIVETECFAKGVYFIRILSQHATYVEKIIKL